MSRIRILIAASMVMVVAGLMLWQYRRSAVITGCTEGGGFWTGTDCRPDPNRIILQRDLHRS